MPNTNFQTFHQMGQAINEVVRQATGRDAVQNIDMDHVTVAQNHYYEEVTLSAGRVSFTDRVGNTPLEKCVVQIEPVQDLHGYDRPWAGGSGKNILPFTVDEIKAVNTRGTWSENVYTYAGVAYTLLTDNDNNIIGVHVVGTATSGVYSRLDSPFFTPADGTYILSGCPSGGSIAKYHLRLGTTESDTIVGADGGSGFEFTASGNTYRVRIGVQSGTSVDEVFYPMVRKSTDPATYEPYSNICPITGWTGVNIHVSPTTNAQDGTTHSITFPDEAGTVYGGALTVNEDGSGILVVDRQLRQMNSFNWTYEPGSLGFICASTDIKHDIYSEVISSIFAWSTEIKPNMPDNSIRINSANTGGLFVKTLNISTTSDFGTLIAGQTVVFPLENPVTYALTTEQIKTIRGINNIWADTGNIEVTIKVLKELY